MIIGRLLKYKYVTFDVHFPNIWQFCYFVKCFSSMYSEGKDVGKSHPTVLMDDGYTLTLPSGWWKFFLALKSFWKITKLPFFIFFISNFLGAKIGHRSLFLYYKQRLKPVECESKNDCQRKEALKKAVIGQYKELGWIGTSGLFL